MQTSVIAPSTVPQEVPLSLLVESPSNPRQHFDENDLKELADFVHGHKICLLFRRPFCCRGRGEPHGNRRLPYVIGT
jgi:hypothetical protein